MNKNNDAMEFASSPEAPGRRQAEAQEIAAGQGGKVHQPGQGTDTVPDSERSIEGEQISLHLSDGPEDSFR